MKTVNGKRFCRILEDNGWELKRVKGSHHIYSRERKPVRLSVPVHGKTPLKIGLLRHLMKAAGNNESDLG